MVLERSCGLRVGVDLATMFPVHAGLDLLQLTLTSQKLLSLLVDLPLDLDLDLAELLLFASQLLLLQADRLASEVFGFHRRVTMGLLVICTSRRRFDNLRSSTTFDGLAKSFGTVVLVKEVVGDLLEVG